MVDRAFRVAYRVAHGVLRLYWTVRRPRKGGTLVAVWYAGEILIVKNTYRKHHTLPGGYPRAGETPSQTGTRELAEECGIVVGPERVKEAYRGEHLFEGRLDGVTIVEVEVDSRPEIRIDFREIDYARMMAPRQALELLLVPHLREYLVERLQARG